MSECIYVRSDHQFSCNQALKKNWKKISGGGGGGERDRQGEGEKTNGKKQNEITKKLKMKWKNFNW